MKYKLGTVFKAVHNISWSPTPIGECVVLLRYTEYINHWPYILVGLDGSKVRLSEDEIDTVYEVVP